MSESESESVGGSSLSRRKADGCKTSETERAVVVSQSHSHVVVPVNVLVVLPSRVLHFIPEYNHHVSLFY